MELTKTWFIVSSYDTTIEDEMAVSKGYLGVFPDPEGAPEIKALDQTKSSPLASLKNTKKPIILYSEGDMTASKGDDESSPLKMPNFINLEQQVLRRSTIAKKVNSKVVGSKYRLVNNIFGMFSIFTLAEHDCVANVLKE